MQVPVLQWRDASIHLDDVSISGAEDEVTLVSNRVIMRKRADAGQHTWNVMTFKYLIPLATIFTIRIFTKSKNYYTLQSL